MSSNSSLVTYKRISPSSSTRRNKVMMIIPHVIVGQWTAKQGCDYFANPARKGSCNYVIGKDGDIGLCVDESRRAWTSGGLDKYGNPIRVNGISGADIDHMAISIEIASDTTPPYRITDAAFESLVKLSADIARRHNFPELKWSGDKSLVGHPELQNIAVHRWFANKSCPGDYLYGRLGELANRVNALLNVSEPTGTLYRVQVGAFKQKSNADNFLKKIKAAGFDTYLVKVGELYKVQVGAFAEQANAQKMMDRLKAAGYTGFITSGNASTSSTSTSTPKKSNIEIAREIIRGTCSDPRWSTWGNYPVRKERLEAAGYNYSAVQAEVEKLMSK